MQEFNLLPLRYLHNQSHSSLLSNERYLVNSSTVIVYLLVSLAKYIRHPPTLTRVFSRHLISSTTLKKRTLNILYKELLFKKFGGAYSWHLCRSDVTIISLEISPLVYAAKIFF